MYLINPESRMLAPGRLSRCLSFCLLLCLLISFVAVWVFTNKPAQAAAVSENSSPAYGLPVESRQLDAQRPFCPGVLQHPNEEQMVAKAQIAAGSPMMFIENMGQFANEVQYQMWGGSWLLWLGEDRLTFTLFKLSPNAAPANYSVGVARPGGQSQIHTIGLRFVGANSQARLEVFQPLATKVSYFIGNDPDKWYADVPVWGGVRYVDLYPGIDLELSGANGRWQPRLVVRSEAALADVRLQVDGADRMILAGDYLHVDTVVGPFTIPLLSLVSADGESLPQADKPHLQQNEIMAPFASAGSVRTAEESPQGTSTLKFSTYLGALTLDGGRIAVGPNKAIYIGGGTYPYVDGPDDGICGVGQLSDAPCHQAFVSKLNAAGTQLDYFFWFGGDGADAVEDIVVDASGAVYATGSTNSTNFFVTAGALSSTHGNGVWDGFVTKVNPSGTSAAYSTYLPATVEELGYDIASDASGAAFVTGEFVAGSYTNAMVLKLNSAGNNLIYGASLGGSFADAGLSITVDSNDAAYVTGITFSPNYPTTPGALQTGYGTGNHDGFVTKLNSNGNMVYSTFLPTDSTEAGRGIAVDSNGFVYIAGPTNLASFVMKLSQNGQSQIYSKILSGNDTIQANGIAVDAKGSVYLTGVALATNFPTTANALQPTKPLHNGDPRDSFIAKYDGQGELVYGTYLGGNERDYGTRIAVDQDGAAYATGFTNSPSVWEGGGFPTTNGSFRPLYVPGCQDPYVVKLTINGGLNNQFLPTIVR